jgi:hypothetical protein
MRIQVFLLLDISNRDAIELSRFSTTCRIHRYQDRPSNARANNTDEDQGAQESKEEVRVQRLMVQHELVWDNTHRVQPIPIRIALTWRAIFLGHGSDERPWEIDLWKFLTNEHKGDGE